MRPLICTADWHIRASNPRIRSDEYATVQYRKIKWIIELAERKSADIVVAGDIFDAPRCPYWLLTKYMRLFSEFDGDIYVVPGQHDLHFHNPDLDNTPLGAMIEARVMHIPDNSDIRGVGWEEEISDKKSLVLLIHTPVTPEAPPFFMEDAVSAADMLDKLADRKYDLIISGDYHVAHCTISNNSILCNPGPIMRSSKDKMGYVPKVFFYDNRGINKGIEEIEIPIEKDVFDLSKIEQDDRKSYGEELKELINSFDVKQKSLPFWEVVDIVSSKMKPAEEVLKILNEVKESHHEQHP